MNVGHEHYSINPFSSKLIFGRTIKFLRKFYRYFSFYAREKNFKYGSFFFAIRLNFHRTMKKNIENPVKYELFLPRPLTLTLF